MHVRGLRSPYAKVGGIVYFGRMVDKIRLQDAGRLPPGYNLGADDWWFFDARCTRFLGIGYEALVERVRRGDSDRSVLQWCFRAGRKPSEEEIEIWNTFMRKRGWNDDTSESVQEEKAAAGLGDREDIVTWFDLFEAEERPKVKPVKPRREPRTY